jgi:hypothetical protein
VAAEGIVRRLELVSHSQANFAAFRAAGGRGAFI